MHHLLQIWFGWVLNGGYLGIIALMAMESSIIPVPSEIVIPPAAFLAARGDLSYAGVILAGTFGSYLGAAITYWVSRWLGRAVILRFGKFFFVSQEKLERAEIWLARYEAGGIFFARLLPVIRHLISIPAGIVRMSFWIFSLVTIVGSALWCAVLTYLGAKAYEAQPDLIRNPDGLMHLMKAQSHWIVLFVAVLAILYLLVLRLSAKRTRTEGAPAR
ncbi:MAG TPA: DedA family protein [Chthoniobacterales bacterium]|jgi:membrane protein DedA with SNARE-associated domain|nr:DedA family protein [Chthoniobacterales bacterium]